MAAAQEAHDQSMHARPPNTRSHVDLDVDMASQLVGEGAML
jgi:hypothetical protein